MLYTQLEYYIFRVEERYETVREIITFKSIGGVWDGREIKKICRKDTMPQRLTLYQPCDGKVYSDFGGAVLVVKLNVSINKSKHGNPEKHANVVAAGVSVCSANDRFNFTKGGQIAFARMDVAEYKEIVTPDDIPEEFSAKIVGITNNTTKYMPVLTQQIIMH